MFGDWGIEEDLNILFFVPTMSRKVWFAILNFFCVSCALTDGYYTSINFVVYMYPIKSKKNFI